MSEVIDESVISVSNTKIPAENICFFVLLRSARGVAFLFKST